MMIKVRESFETNSSSAHTFVIKNETAETTDDEIKEFFPEAFDSEKKVLTFDYSGYPCGYDDEFEVLDTWYDKTRYLVLGYFNKIDFDYIEAIIEALKRRIPNLDGINVIDSDITDYSYKKLSPRNKHFVQKSSYFDLDATINHQSNDLPESIFKATNNGRPAVDVFYDLIFSKENAIVIMSDCNSLDDMIPDLFPNLKSILIECYHYNNNINDSYYTYEFKTPEEYRKRYEDEDF